MEHVYDTDWRDRADEEAASHGHMAGRLVPAQPDARNTGTRGGTNTRRQCSDCLSLPFGTVLYRRVQGPAPTTNSGVGTYCGYGGGPPPAVHRPAIALSIANRARATWNVSQHLYSVSTRGRSDWDGPWLSRVLPVNGSSRQQLADLIQTVGAALQGQEKGIAAAPNRKQPPHARNAQDTLAPQPFLGLSFAALHCIANKAACCTADLWAWRSGPTAATSFGFGLFGEGVLVHEAWTSPIKLWGPGPEQISIITATARKSYTPLVASGCRHNSHTFVSALDGVPNRENDNTSYRVHTYCT